VYPAKNLSIEMQNILSKLIWISLIKISIANTKIDTTIIPNIDIDNKDIMPLLLPDSKGYSSDS